MHSFLFQSCATSQWDIVSDSLSAEYIKRCDREPNCGGGSENCMNIWGKNCYNDYSCVANVVFLCQYGKIFLLNSSDHLQNPLYFPEP